MGTVTKGKIGGQDIQHYGGDPSNTTFSRPNSTGGVDTLSQVGVCVDALAAYGASAAAKNLTTLSAAVSAVGSGTAGILIAPGTWTVDDDLTVPSGVTLIFPPGASLSIANGKTVTCNGRVLADSRQVFAGSGTFTLNTYPQDDAWWGNTAALILSTGAGGTIKVPWSGLVTTDGDILYYNGTSLVRLGVGAIGTYLQVGASGLTWNDLGATLVVGGTQAAGDVFYDNGTYMVRLAKDAGKYLKSGATAPAWDAIGIDEVTNLSAEHNTDGTHTDYLPHDLISGMELAISAGDAEHDVTAGIGECRDGSDGVDIVFAAAKTAALDASGAGGLDTGAAANATRYYIWAIAKADATSALMYSVSATSPTMPSGYTYKRLLGAVLTDGSANLIATSLAWAGSDGSFAGAISYVRDEKAKNTNGGTFTNGAWRTRDLNTEKTMQIPGATLASNQLTLPAGTYEAHALAPAYAVDYHMAQIYDTTGAAALAYSSGGLTTVNGTFWVHVIGTFRLTTASVIELQHWSSATNADDGFGLPTNLDVEVYAQLWVRKMR